MAFGWLLAASSYSAAGNAASAVATNKITVHTTETSQYLSNEFFPATELQNKQLPHTRQDIDNIMYDVSTWLYLPSLDCHTAARLGGAFEADQTSSGATDSFRAACSRVDTVARYTIYNNRDRFTRSGLRGLQSQGYVAYKVRAMWISDY